MAADLDSMSIKDLDAKWAAASDKDRPAIEKVIEAKLEAGEKPQGEKGSDTKKEKVEKAFDNDVQKALDVLGL